MNALYFDFLHLVFLITMGIVHIELIPIFHGATLLLSDPSYVFIHLTRTSMHIL